LKVFLKSLQLAFQNKINDVEPTEACKPLKVASNSALNKLQQEQPLIKKPRTSMIIREPSNYIEFLRGYKSTQYNFNENLQKLEITNCNMHQNQLNKQLYQYFKQLTYLNLEANNLKFEVNHLNVPSLKELYLSRNEIESFSSETCFMPNLVYLKLSQNKFSKITNKFCRLFQNLKVLHLDENQIVCLNNRFGCYLKSLKTLNLRGNLLKNLPYSIINLRLDMLELDNKGFDDVQVYIDHNENLKYKLFPKLLELTARVIINSKYTRLYF
jgi:Leucine-rich repeat (LRR) protein